MCGFLGGRERRKAALPPDIEEAFSKLKHYLRRAKARTRERLEGAIDEALQRITAEDARNWFTHCGFAVGPQ